MSTITALNLKGLGRRNPMHNSRGAGRKPKPAEDQLVKPKTITFTEAQAARIKSFLERRHPGSSAAAWIRETALRTMEREELDVESNEERVVLDLGKDICDQLRPVAKELGHANLAVFLGEFAARLPQRDIDDVVNLFRGKTVTPPVLQLAPKIPVSESQAASIGQFVFDALQEVTRAQQKAEQDTGQESKADAA